jgi:hypothetical protein
MELPDEVLFNIFKYILPYKRTTISILISCTRFTSIMGEVIINSLSVKAAKDANLTVSADKVTRDLMDSISNEYSGENAVGFVMFFLKTIMRNLCRGARCEMNANDCKIHGRCDSCNAVDEYLAMKSIQYTAGNIYLCAHCATSTCNICYVRDIQSYAGTLSLCNSCKLANSVKCIQCYSTSVSKILRKAYNSYCSNNSMVLVYGCSECTSSTGCTMHENGEYQYDEY